MQLVDLSLFLYVDQTFYHLPGTEPVLTHFTEACQHPPGVLTGTVSSSGKSVGESVRRPFYARLTYRR